MLEQLNMAVTDYHVKWQALISQRSNKAFFQKLKPVTVGWKVGDYAEYQRAYVDLHDHADRIVETWMNERWIAKVHLRDNQLPGGISIVKIMQRRPDSRDAVGLDHVDFYDPEVVNAESVLKEEKDLEWTLESNDVIQGYEWVSIWFEGTEAKLKASTVIDIVTQELQEMNDKIKTGPAN